MNNTPTHILDKIDAYLNGTMMGTDKAQFEQDLLLDPSLKQMLEASIEAREVLIDYKTAVFKQKYTNFVQKEKIKRQRIYVATATCAVLGLLWLGSKLGQEPNPTSVNIHDTTTLAPIVQKDANHLHKHPDTKLLEKSKPTSAKSGIHTVEMPKPVVPSTHTPALAETLQTPLSQERAAPIAPTAAKAPTLTPSKELHAFDCSQTIINFTAHAEASCTNQDNGSIRIDRLPTGGKAPYAYYVEDASGHHALESLASGEYWVVVKDYNGCMSKKKTYVASKSCVELQEFTMDPNLEDHISLGTFEAGGTVAIHSKAGRLVHTHTLSANDAVVWDGKDMQGNKVQEGVYLYSVSKGAELLQKGYIHVVSSH